MEAVNMFDAKSNLSRLVAAAIDGEDVVIANRGKPVARIVPVGDTRVSSGAALSAWLTQNPAPGVVRRSAADIETQLQELRESW